MKTCQFCPLRYGLFLFLLGFLAVQAMTCQGQVTAQQITNGLVSYYPLDQLLPGTTNVTPDLIARRDLTMYLGSMAAYQNGPAAIVAGSHPGMGGSTAVMNLPQTPAATVLVYQSTGQNPLDGSGDFLPFINQRNATMNFWIKGVLPAGDQRVMAECADNGDNQAFFSLSSQPSSRSYNGLGYFLRENVPVTAPNGVSANQFPDGTYQTPASNYLWFQSSQYTTNILFDNNWHMLTTVISSNGDVHAFVDGNYDPGDQTTPTTDHEGNPAICPPLNVTNTYYVTNTYPFSNPPTNSPPPSGYVHWMIPGLNLAGAFTTFGGFDRNGSISAGPPIQMSDIAFWNRVLSQDEIRFLMTNGIPSPGPPPPTPRIISFTTDMPEVGTGDTVALRWNVIGATYITISGLGDVTSLGLIASTNVTVTGNTNYTLTAANGLVAPRQATLSIKALPGVSPDWHLIQRFDGVFSNTSGGINGNGWVSLLGTYLGPLDRFNVVTVNSNKALSPRSGYLPDTNSLPFGYDTTGSLTYAVLNGFTIPPYETHTLFLRFSLRDPQSQVGSHGIYSGIDFALGLTDWGFATGPLPGQQPPGANGTLGPGFHIVRYDSSRAYGATPFDLTAADWNGTNNSYNAGYDYLASVNTNGLQQNANYMVWLDVSNDNTHSVINGGVTTTLNEPVFSMWLQKQGDPGPTLLFSGFHGDRTNGAAGCGFCDITPYLNKIFCSIGTENFTNGDYGAFFETNNMLVLDDFYLSKNGYNHTIPRLFQIASTVRGSTNATITWYSLGSLFQTNSYTVQRTFRLVDPVWITLTNGLPSGGDLTSFTDYTVGPSDTAFYRIVWP